MRRPTRGAVSESTRPAPARSSSCSISPSRARSTNCSWRLRERSVTSRSEIANPSAVRRGSLPPHAKGGTPSASPAAASGCCSCARSDVGLAPATGRGALEVGVRHAPSSAASMVLPSRRAPTRTRRWRFATRERRYRGVTGNDIARSAGVGRPRRGRLVCGTRHSGKVGQNVSIGSTGTCRTRASSSS
jgi:hypothetical protein